MDHITHKAGRESLFRKKLAGKWLLFLLLALIPLGFSADPVAARETTGPRLIRDAEIEQILGDWAAPLIQAAGLDAQAVRIRLIESPDVNAFVAGGPNIFIHTGLLMKSSDPGEVAGVIAHELGHITGGHLIRTREAVRDASWEAMAGTLLGIGAAIATGQSGAAGALSLGSQSMALRNLLAHSRVQESSADQAALKFMARAGYDPSGLVTFLEKIGGADFSTQTAEIEYVRTHPLTGNRTDSLRGGVAASPEVGKGWSAETRAAHARMKAKLVGFLTPDQVSWYFEDRDVSVAAEYARTIGAWRTSRVEDALRRMDSLLKKEPDNPYFHEIKGQMLLEFGRVAEAVASYRAAVERQPGSGLLRIDLGRSLIALADSRGDRESYDAAIETLTRALRSEPQSGLAHRLLATAYGKTGREPLARLHLAEEALLKRRIGEARRLAESAQADLPVRSPEAQRARDILAATARAKKDRADDGNAD